MCRNDSGSDEGFKLIAAGFCVMPNPHRSDRLCACFDNHHIPHAIWGLSFIDRRAFRPIEGYVPSLIESDTYARHWDGSMMRFCVPNSNPVFEVRAKEPRVDGNHNDIQDNNDNNIDDSDMESEDEGVYESSLDEHSLDHLDDEDDDADFAARDGSGIPCKNNIPTSLQVMQHPWSANVQPLQRRTIGGSLGGHYTGPGDPNS